MDKVYNILETVMVSKLKLANAGFPDSVPIYAFNDDSRLPTTSLLLLHLQRCSKMTKMLVDCKPSPKTTEED